MNREFLTLKKKNKIKMNFNIYLTQVFVSNWKSVRNEVNKF